MANIRRYDPFAELRALQRQFFDDGFSGLPRAAQLWPTDVYTEDDTQMIVEAHLPDFDQKDVNVSVDNGVLEIQAEKHERDEEKKRQYVVRESSRSFYRRLQLPERAEADNITAHMEHGVLKVTVPLKSLPAPKKIAIDKAKK